MATELDNPMTIGYVRAFDAVLAALEPEGHDLDAAVAAADTVASTMHIDYFAMMAELLCGWRDSPHGRPRGLAAMQQATERMRPSNRWPSRSGSACWRAPTSRPVSPPPPGRRRRGARLDRAARPALSAPRAAPHRRGTPRLSGDRAGAWPTAQRAGRRGRRAGVAVAA